MKRFYQFLATFADGDVRLVGCRAYSYEDAVAMFPHTISLILV